MTGNRRTLIVAGLCVVITASTALAGGGGSKRDTKLRVHNGGSTQVGVAVGLSDLELMNIANSSDPVAAWRRAGGRVLNPGQTVTFKVNEGETRIVTAFDPAEGLADDETVDLDKGEDRRVTIDDDGQIDTDD